MNRALFVFVVATVLAMPVIAYAAAPSSTFDFDDEGWTADNAVVSYEASGGNPGGFLKIVDNIDGGITSDIKFPSKFRGDMSQYNGWTLSYDHIVLSPTAPLTDVGSGWGRLGILGGGQMRHSITQGTHPFPRQALGQPIEFL